ncbi:MAG: hypothetical protein IPQ12_10245 [Polaromonas sp.]|nr:hypothetical protein [Polaromonas sp.]
MPHSTTTPCCYLPNAEAQCCRNGTATCPNVLPETAAWLVAKSSGKANTETLLTSKTSISTA